MTPLSASHALLRTRAWQASAVAFVLFLFDMFILQQGQFFLNLFLTVFGFTMIVDGIASIKTKKFSYFGISFPEPFAQIGGGIIVFVGIFVFLGGVTSLLS